MASDSRISNHRTRWGPAAITREAEGGTGRHINLFLFGHGSGGFTGLGLLDIMTIMRKAVFFSSNSFSGGGFFFFCFYFHILAARFLFTMACVRVCVYARFGRRTDGLEG